MDILKSNTMEKHFYNQRNMEMNNSAINRRSFLRLMAGMGGLTFLDIFCSGSSLSEAEVVKKPINERSRKLIMGSAVDLSTIDPAVGFDKAIGSSLKGLYDTLFRFVGNPPRLTPWLVETYKMSENASVWTFTLVKNAVFHDGSPVTAKAVKYSAERLMRIGKGCSSLFTGILGKDSVKVINDYTLEIRLLKPFGPFLQTLTWLFIVNPKVVEAHAGNDDGQTWLNEHEAGSGPFFLGQWKPGELYEFKANPDYWKGWPSDDHLDGYVRKVSKNAQERIKGLEKGEFNFIDWVSPQEQLRLRKKGFVLSDESPMELLEIKLNNEVGYTANIHVRKAISYAFDYMALKKIWCGRAMLSKGPLPSYLEAWISKDFESYYHDLEKAKTEIKKSPWPSGGFSLDFVYVRGLDEEKKTGEIMRNQLAKLNIHVNIIPMAWVDAVSTFKSAKTSPAMFPIYASNAYPDPDNFLWSGYHSSKKGEWTNPGHYQNPKMDKLLEQARATAKTAMRRKFYYEAQKLAVAEAVNVFGVSSLDYHVASPLLQVLNDYCPVMGSAESFYWFRIKDE